MSIRKRNEFLEGDESGDALDDGYDSDEAEESRAAISRRPSKRQRVDEDADEDSDDGLEDDEPSLQVASEVFALHGEKLHDVEAALEEDEEAEAGDILPKRPPPKHVAAAQKAARRSGVIYISRVPPFMKPQTLKHFLAPHAPKGLGRIFLTPEDHVAHTRRVRSGGNKKKSFTDGWVEFTSKRDAKIAAQILNGNIIGGKKGNFYHDDLWSMKYLKGFKWSHLTEQIANENAERAARMREEVRKTKEENKAFMDDVERGKMLEGMESKKKVKQARGGVGGEGGGDEIRTKRNDFKQKAVQPSREGEQVSEQAAKMQSLIF